MRMTRFLGAAALSTGLTLSAFAVALAQPTRGAFDGQWVVDVPPSPTLPESSESVCPALRFPVRIADGRLMGALTRVPSNVGGAVIEQGSGPRSAPIAGAIEADGTLHAQWENYHASGKLSGDTGEITVQTECGPTVATAVRVSP
jgi:hypothetical protein